MDCADKKLLRCCGGEEGVAEARFPYGGEEGAGLFQVAESAHLHPIEGSGSFLRRLTEGDAEVIAQPLGSTAGDVVQMMFR